jgi:hypothetical protein
MARDPLVLAEEMPSWAADGGALDPLVGPQCSLAVQLRRATGAVIGRTAELDAIAQEIRESAGRLSAVTLANDYHDVFITGLYVWLDDRSYSGSANGKSVYVTELKADKCKLAFFISRC